MASSTYATKSLYVAGYLLTVLDVAMPTVTTDAEGIATFTFPDPDGQVSWAGQAFGMDLTVQKFVTSLRKLRNLIRQQQQF
jgi:hypothetical protein